MRTARRWPRSTQGPTTTSGRIVVEGTDLTGLDDRALTRLRRDRLGFVFQSFNLVPLLDARENVTLPMDLAGRHPDPGWLDTVIGVLGLGDRLRHRPHELSGGQQQRVAIARALAGRPALVLADEPTGSLDTRSSADVLSFLRSSVDDLGQTVVMVTHDPAAAAYADRVVFLQDGRAAGAITAPTVDAVLARMKALTDEPDARPAAPIS